MRKFAILFLSVCIGTQMMAKTITFEPDMETDFPNPERGFYNPSSMYFTRGNATTNLTKEFLEQNRLNNRTLVLREYWFNSYRDRALTDTVFDVIRADMQLFRENGNKVIIRFAYTDRETKKDGKYQDAYPELWQQHLEQLKPILHEAEDVIACVQAGFLGVWGEWYYSSQGTGNSIPKQVKKNLLSWLLDAVPVSRSVQVRTPLYKTIYIGDTVPLSADSAFNGSARARIGHHNDAVFNGESNMGTYQNRRKDMAYVAQDCLFLPIGGETDLIASQDNAEQVYKKWSTGPIVQNEMYQLHYDYLNMAYSSYVLQKWKQEPYGKGSYFDLISRSLGYRYAMRQAFFPDSTGKGEKMPYRLVITNYGYSTVYNARPVKLVFRPIEGGEDYIVNVHTDPRFWGSGWKRTVIEDSIALPDMLDGTYHLYLYMPDSAASLRDDPRQAIRFANDQIWNDSTGYNDLLAEVTVCTGCVGEIEDYDDTPVPSVEAVAEDAKKFFRNGQLVIRYQGHLYNTQGVCIE